jgi:anti-sigma regulatory factor (Ser/Thr protein kinase)
MVNRHYKSFRADDRSFFSLIKKDIHQQVVAAEFDGVRAGKIDIVIAEITSNLGKYANGGQILSGVGSDGYGEYFEVVCVDEGPGIPDLGRVLSDGYSSTGSLGHGLGSIKRLSDQFDLYSIRDWGTILVSRVYKDELPGVKKKKIDCVGLNVPKTGEQVSGDGFFIDDGPDHWRILVADGLGHGVGAHAAVETAGAAFAECADESPTETIRFLHDRIRKTRGVVGVVIVLDKRTRRWKIAGVGNISIKWMGQNGSRTYVSYNGIIGFNIPGSINDQELSQDDFHQFIACSDGIRSRWDIGRFPGIGVHHGMIIASAIYKEFARGTDDTSIIVCKSD